MSLAISLYSIQQNIYRIGGPILIAIGSISCILNLMVFTKNTLRKNPCTICFIAVNIINFIFFYISFLLSILTACYGIDPSANNIGFCRFQYYVGLVLACWGSSCLILASIDRTLVTSRNSGTRKRSSCRLMIISMTILALFWMLFHIHAWIFTEILQLGPNYYVCYYQPGTYMTFMTYYSLVMNGSLPPLLMTLFGLLTVKNIRQVHRTIHYSNSIQTGITAIGRPHVLKSKDRQLIRMLLLDIILYMLCKCPVTIFYIYQEITQYHQKTLEQQTIEQSILQIVYFWYFVDNSISCYTNILISKTFRIELKRTLLNIRIF